MPAHRLRSLLLLCVAVGGAACSGKEEAVDPIVRRGSGHPGVASSAASDGVPGDPATTYRDPWTITRAVSGPVNTAYYDVAGWRDIVATTFRDFVFGDRMLVQFMRYNRNTPDELVDLGKVYLGVPTYGHDLVDLRIFQDQAVAAVRDELQAGTLVFISLAGGPAVVSQLPVTTVPMRAAVNGRWAAYASNAELTLVDLADPAAPRPVRTFDAGGLVTSLVPVADGFVVFHEIGHGHLVADAASPTYVSATHPVTRALASIQDEGLATIFASGPGFLVGRARLGTLDLADPAAPVFTPLGEVDGNYAGFGCDGAGRCALQVSRAADDLPFPVPEYSFHLFTYLDASLTYVEERPAPSGVLTPFHLRSARIYVTNMAEFQIRRMPAPLSP